MAAMLLPLLMLILVDVGSSFSSRISHEVDRVPGVRSLPPPVSTFVVAALSTETTHSPLK